MDTTPRTASSSSHPSADPAPGPAPRPTSGRENGGLMYFFIGAAVLALLLVVGFNMLGPDGASRTGVGDGPAQSSAGPTTGGPSPGAATQAGAAGSSQNEGATGAGTGSPTTTTANPAQRGDTPTPVGRESVGAPAGGAPQTTQGRTEGVSGDGTTAGDTPAAAARSGASAIPAAPAASR